MATFSEYDTALAASRKAQAEDLLGRGEFSSTGRRIDLIPLEEEVALRYAEMEQKQLDQLLKGKEIREVLGTELIGGGKDITRADFGGYEVLVGQKTGNGEAHWWYLIDPETNEKLKNADGSVIAVASNDATTAESALANLANKAGYKSKAYEQDILGDVTGRAPGVMDLLTTSKARRYDPVTKEFTYGQAGFDESGNFTGLGTAQAETQAAQSTITRESDVADIEMLGGRVTDAIRSQGDIQPLLDRLSTLQQSGQESTQDIRDRLLGKAKGLLTDTLTGREVRDIVEASRSAGVATGRIRDTGRVVGEVADLVMGNRQRQVENLGLAQGLLGNELGIQQQQFGQAISRLGAEQSTAADPVMAITGRQGTQATSAGTMLGAGSQIGGQAGPKYIGFGEGLDYIGGREAAIGNLEAAQIGADAMKKAGQYKLAGQVFESIMGKIPTGG